MVGVRFLTQSFVSALTIGGYFDPFNLNNAFGDAPNSVVYKGILQHYPVFQPLGNVCLTFGLCDHHEIVGHPNAVIFEKQDGEIFSARQADFPLITMNVVPVSVTSLATTPWTPTPTTSTAHPSSPIHATCSTDPAFAIAYNSPHTTSEFHMMSSSMSPPASTPRPKITGINVTVSANFFEPSTDTSFGHVPCLLPLAVIPRDGMLVCCLVVGCILTLIGLGKSLAALFQPVSQSPHASCKYRYIIKRRKARYLKKQKSRRRKAVEADITRYFQDLLLSHGTPVTYPSLHTVLWKKHALEALFNTEALKAQHEEDIGRLEYWQSLATRWRESYLSADAARLHSDTQLNIFKSMAEELKLATKSQETALLHSDTQLNIFKRMAEELQIAAKSQETALLDSNEQLETFKSLAEELQIAAKSHEKELKESQEAVDLTWDMKEAAEKEHDDFKRAANADKVKLEAEVKSLRSSLARLESQHKKESLSNQDEPATAQGDITTLFTLIPETTVDPADGEGKEKKKKRPRRNPTHRPTQLPSTSCSDERQAPVAVEREAPKNLSSSLLSSVLSDVDTSTPWLSSRDERSAEFEGEKEGRAG